MAKEMYTDIEKEPVRPLINVHSVDLVRAGESYLNSLPQNKQDVAALADELKTRGFADMAAAVLAESRKR